jgi:hypothetical protein
VGAARKSTLQSVKSEFQIAIIESAAVGIIRALTAHAFEYTL